MKANRYISFGAAAVAALALASAPMLAQQGAKPSPAHNHIGHVMKSWKDTPNTQGFLPVAVADAKVAQAHAGYMQKSPDNLQSLQNHAGHVLNALDPSLVEKGPGSGYGVKRATAGALQHIQLAAKSEGASKGVQTHTTHVSTALNNVTKWTDGAIATAQKIRGAKTAAEAKPLVDDLITQTNNIVNGVDADKNGSIGWQENEGGLAQAETHMNLMMKGEGIM